MAPVPAPSILAIGGEDIRNGGSGGGGGPGSPGGGPGSVLARASKENMLSEGAGALGANPAGAIRLVESNDEQTTLNLTSDALSALVTLPGARIAVCGSQGGTIHVVECAPPSDERPEKLYPRGQALRPHAGAVAVLHASRDERLVISAGVDGSLFVLERSDAKDPAGGGAAGGGGPSGEDVSKRRGSSQLQLGAGRGGLRQYVGGRSVGLLGSAEAVKLLTEVQCISREALEAQANSLADARSQYLQLQTAVAQEAIRTEARIAATLAQQQREHAEALAEHDKKQRTAAAAHNSEVAELHKRFADFASKRETEAKLRQSHLETTLRREIAQHEDVGAELTAVRDKAASKLAELSLQVQEAAEDREQLEARTAGMLDDVKAEYEEDLQQLDEMADARQKQLLDEYAPSLRNLLQSSPACHAHVHV